MQLKASENQSSINQKSAMDEEDFPLPNGGEGSGLDPR